VGSLFTPLNNIECHDYYCNYGARENQSGLVVMIKEISLVHMEHISEELLIYKELELREINDSGILDLYQSHIDRDSYLLIK